MDALTDTLARLICTAENYADMAVTADQVHAVDCLCDWCRCVRYLDLAKRALIGGKSRAGKVWVVPTDEVPF